MLFVGLAFSTPRPRWWTSTAQASSHQKPFWFRKHVFTLTWAPNGKAIILLLFSLIGMSHQSPALLLQWVSEVDLGQSSSIFICIPIKVNRSILPPRQWLISLRSVHSSRVLHSSAVFYHKLGNCWLSPSRDTLWWMGDCGTISPYWQPSLLAECWGPRQCHHNGPSSRFSHFYRA